MAENTICRVCREGVNSFSDGQTVVWAHARSWETHDHDAEPETVPLGVGKLDCDFCGAGEPVRWVWSSRHELRMGNVNAGKDWGACVLCDQLLRRRDLDGLVARNAETKAATWSEAKVAEFNGRPLTEQDKLRFGESRREFFAALMNLLVLRAALPPPPPPPSPLSATRLPKVRDKLVDFWTTKEHLISGAASEENAVLLPGVDVGRPDIFSALVTQLPTGGAQPFCDRMATGLSVGELFWVSKEYTLLAVTRGRKLPDLTINRHQLPAPSGLIVYEHPIMEQVAAGRLAKTTAVSWVLVPDGIWITLYAQPEQVMPEHDREHVRASFGWLMPVAPGAGLKFGVDADRALIERYPSMKALATLLATFFLIRQPRITEITEQQPIHHRERRAYARSGRQLPTIRIVDINRKPRSGKTNAGTGTGSKWSVRVLVGADEGGFWRNQYYPSSDSHERIWIEEFWAGPEDGQVRVGGVDVVNVLR